MAEYPLTDAQIMQIAYRVRGLIRAESRSVPEVPMADSIEGIESFPVVQKIGGVSKYARVPLSLISEGISDITDSRIKDVIDDDYIMGIAGPSVSGMLTDIRETVGLIGTPGDWLDVTGSISNAIGKIGDTLGFTGFYHEAGGLDNALNEAGYSSLDGFVQEFGYGVSRIWQRVGFTGLADMLDPMWETVEIVGRPAWDGDKDISQVLSAIGQTIGITGFDSPGRDLRGALDNAGYATLGDFVNDFGVGTSHIWQNAGFTGLADILAPMWDNYSGFITSAQQALSSGDNYGGLYDFIFGIGEKTQAVYSQYGFTGLADLLQEICNQVGITGYF